MNFLEIISRGEYVIIALAVILIVVIIIWSIRVSVLKHEFRLSRTLMPRLRDYIMEGDLENALHLCQNIKGVGSLVIGCGVSYMGRPMPEIHSAMRLVNEANSSSLEKGSRWLYAFAVISPLIGLGGTLAGICNILQRVAQTGPVTDMAIIANEIAPSIITTCAGIVVGLFSYIAYICLDGYVAKAKQYISKLSIEFTDILNSPS